MGKGAIKGEALLTAAKSGGGATLLPAKPIALLSARVCMAKTGAKRDSGARASRPGRQPKGMKAMAEQEMKAANETYSGFISLLKVGSIITIVTTVVVVLLIAS
jgi:hypothetical protein